MKPAILLFAAALTLGCGNDSGEDVEIDAGDEIDAAESADAATTPDARTARGTATITGTVGGEAISPLGAFLIDHPAGHKVLVMSEDAGVHCEVTSSAGLVFVLGFQCGEPEVGTQAINNDFDCEQAPGSWALVEGFEGSGPSEYVAASGTLTVDALDAPGAETNGSFTADFGVDGAVTGTFDAVICD